MSPRKQAASGRCRRRPLRSRSVPHSLGIERPRPSSRIHSTQLQMMPPGPHSQRGAKKGRRSGGTGVGSASERSLGFRGVGTGARAGSVASASMGPTGGDGAGSSTAVFFRSCTGAGCTASVAWGRATGGGFSELGRPPRCNVPQAVAVRLVAARSTNGQRFRRRRTPPGPGNAGVAGAPSSSSAVVRWAKSRGGSRTGQSLSWIVLIARPPTRRAAAPGAGPARGRAGS